MKSCASNAVFDWIEQGRIKLPPRFVGQPWSCRVHHLVPPQIERYAKILHSLEAHFENIDNPPTEKEIKILGIPDCKLIKAFVENRRTTSAGNRFRWEEIAGWLNVPFRPEISHEWFVERLNPNPQCWPRFIYGPAEGSLDAIERDELASVLMPFTDGSECFFRFAEIPFVGTDGPLLFQGSLASLGEFLSHGHYQYSPEYWWPADRAWCICSDYDLGFTIVGGCGPLIDTLLRNKVLEVVEASAETRVDSLILLPSR